MDAKEEDREIRSEIALLADEWRAIARAMPHWHVDRSGDEIVLRQSPHGQPLATLHGEWAPNLARFFEAMDPTAGCTLAELLWRIGGYGGSTDIRDMAISLFVSLRLKEPKARYRPS